VFVIPAFEPDTGQLPPGEHEATWAEITDRFGWNERRRQLLDGLAEALAILGDAGCTRVWLNGSFVTAKDGPGDFDAVWQLAGTDWDRLVRLAPEIVDLSNHRAAQQLRFGGELFPNVVVASSGRSFELFFQADRDGNAKGIVVIDPAKEVWR
jgi:hypothetical protein